MDSRMIFLGWPSDNKENSMIEDLKELVDVIKADNKILYENENEQENKIDEELKLNDEFIDDLEDIN